MKKKILSLILCISMICGIITGCGDSDGNNNATEVEKDGGVVDKDNTSNEIKDKLDDYVLYLTETENTDEDILTHYYNKDGGIHASILTYYEDITSCHKYENEFDDKGNLIKTISYNSDGGLYESREYENGKLVKFYRQHNMRKGVPDTYEYDEKGRLIKLVHTTEGYHWEIYTTTYTYDTDGKLIEEITVSESFEGDTSVDKDKDYVYDSKYEYIYDEDGNLKEKIQYDIHGEISYIENNIGVTLSGKTDGTRGYDFEHVFDKNGYLVSYTEVSADDIAYEYEFENDKDGNVLKVYKYDDYGNCLSELSLDYARDDKGNVTEIKIYDGDELQRKLECLVEYDEKGNLIHESKYIPYYGNFYLRIDYGYDSKGNIIKEAVSNADNWYVSGFSYSIDETDNSIIYEEYSENTIEREKYVEKNADFDSLLAEVDNRIKVFENNHWRNLFIETIEVTLYPDSERRFSSEFRVVDINEDGIDEIIAIKHIGNHTSTNACIMMYNGTDLVTIPVCEFSSKMSYRYRYGFYLNSAEKQIKCKLYSQDSMSYVHSSAYKLVDGNLEKVTFEEVNDNDMLLSGWLSYDKILEYLKDGLM